MIKGHDALLIGHPLFKAEVLIQGAEPNSMLGWFEDTWKESPGDPFKKVKKCLSVERFVQGRAQIFWSYAHKPAPLSLVVKALPRLARLQDETGKRIYASPSCEYDASTPKKLVEQWVKAIQKIGLTPVLTPMGGPVVPGVLIEKHGDKVANAQALSLDGEAFTDCDASRLVKLNSTAEYILGWIPRYNLAVAGSNALPAQRKNPPSVKDVRSVSALFGPCVYGNLKGRQLWKTHAEDKGTGDPRANKPLAIIKEKAKFIEILDSANAPMFKFPYYGTYLDQGHRYYSGSPGGPKLYAYEIGDLARQRTGSDVVKIRVNGKVYTVGSAAFRQGYYQS